MIFFRIFRIRHMERLQILNIIFDHYKIKKRKKKKPRWKMETKTGFHSSFFYKMFIFMMWFLRIRIRVWKYHFVQWIKQRKKKLLLRYLIRLYRIQVNQRSKTWWYQFFSSFTHALNLKHSMYLQNINFFPVISFNYM